MIWEFSEGKTQVLLTQQRTNTEQHKAKDTYHIRATCLRMQCNLHMYNLVNIMLCYTKSLQSCPTLCDPIDGSPPGSPVPGILQARTLEWVAISFSNAWKWKVKMKSLSRVRLLATPWTVAYQAPPSMGFPSKSTRVACHCLLRDIYIYIYIYMCVCVCVCIRSDQSLSRVRLFATPWMYSLLHISDSAFAYGLTNAERLLCHTSPISKDTIFSHFTFSASGCYLTVDSMSHFHRR